MTARIQEEGSKQSIKKVAKAFSLNPQCTFSEPALLGRNETPATGSQCSSPQIVPPDPSWLFHLLGDNAGSLIRTAFILQSKAGAPKVSNAKGLRNKRVLIMVLCSTLCEQKVGHAVGHCFPLMLLLPPMQLKFIQDGHDDL